MPTITAASASYPFQPSGIVPPLFEHQAKMLEATLAFEADSTINLGSGQTFVSNVGFISCPPGAGKSLVILAMACHEAEHRHETNKMMTLTSGSSIHVELPKLPTTLVIVPDFLVQQWGSYVRSMTTIPLFQYNIMTSRNDVQVFANKTLEQQRVYSILICNPETYQLIAGQFHFKRIVFDEVDSIKIPNCETPAANMIWGVSSNIDHIKKATTVNRGFLRTMMKEISALFSSQGTHNWDALIFRTDKYFLERSLNIQRYNMVNVACLPEFYMEDCYNTEKLKWILSLGMEERIAELLWVELVPNDREMFSLASQSKKEDYSALTYDYLQKLENNSEELMENFILMQTVAKELIKDIQNMPERIANETCPIAQDTIVHKACTFCCQNTFEFASLLSWVLVKHTCPMCRCTIDSNDIILKKEVHVSPTSVLYSYMTTKEVSFKNTIRERTDTSRIVIFAGDEIATVRTYLAELEVPYCEMSGRIINKTLYNFNAGVPNMLLVNHHKFATGLNLTMATQMVIFDEVSDDEILAQIIGRSFRAGLGHALEVIRYNVLKQN